MFDRVFERQVLERVQRVVVDEDADRSLRRQQVRELIDDVASGDDPASWSRVSSSVVSI